MSQVAIYDAALSVLVMSLSLSLFLVMLQLLLRRCCMFDLWMLCSDDLTGGEFLSTQD
jgi:hypothetical protein